MSVDFYKEFGELGYLANYSNHGFYEDGVFYKTVEHYYQAKKYDNPTIIKKILDADTPKEASTIGRDRSNIRIPNFKNIKAEWLDLLVDKLNKHTASLSVNDGIMATVNLIKWKCVLENNTVENVSAEKPTKRIDFSL